MTQDTIAAYVRVSTQDQKDEGSHHNQIDRIETWAQRNGYDDLEVFQDIAVSGQSQNRAAYNDLMDRIDEFDAIVVRELSRFGRDPMTVLKDVEEIVDSETEFVSITEDFDTSSAMGKAFLRIVAVINGMYADLRREQAIRGAERRKEQGLDVGRPKKLDDTLINEAIDLRNKGVSYSAIARVMESKPNGPDSISRGTIRRYCKDIEEVSM
jgi:DNA invertase Pin-like site-specific DNA recombinase